MHFQTILNDIFALIEKKISQDISQKIARYWS